MSRIALIVCACLLGVLVSCVSSHNEVGWEAAVVKDPRSGKWMLTTPAQAADLEEAPPNVFALARFHRELEKTGWDRLEVSTSFRQSDEDQAYAAGYAEGRMSAQAIANWYTNFVTIFGASKTPSSRLLSYVSEQLSWTRSKSLHAYMRWQKQQQSQSTRKPVVDDTKEDAFWRQVHMIYQQLVGVLDGYNEAMPNKPLTLIDMYLLNAAGDLEDLVGWFSTTGTGWQGGGGGGGGGGGPVRHERIRRMLRQYATESGIPDLPMTGLDCSAFVKPVGPLAGGGFTDLLSAHTTWTEYLSMNRVFKQVTIRFRDPAVKAAYVAFSSRPAFLSSKDDFYVTGAGLITQETTNSVLNRTLYTQFISPHTVLTFMRTIIANRLASTGQEWTEYFAMYNSGTYNNQWMVTDTKLFQPGQPIVPNTLWIIEQIPGYTKSGDVTAAMMAQGFWRSYNVPYFKYIYDLSGYQGPCPADGQCPAYVAAPRYAIFGKQQQSVTDIDSLKQLMQYNDYLHDPLSAGDPANAISSRYDLRSGKLHAAPFGGIDSKLSSWAMLRTNVTAHAISGPTHQGLPVFTWANPAFSGTTHVGQPTVWDFDWQPIFNPWFSRP